MGNDLSVTRTEIQAAGDLTIDVSWIVTEDNAEIAVSRIKPLQPDFKGAPVVLVHGTYSKRNFWVSPKGIGIAAYLSNAGFDVWIPELRGHGLSAKGDNFSTITAEEQIRYDLPAVQKHVHGTTGTRQSWIGHSFGGVYILCGLSAKWLDQGLIRNLITFGSQISRGESFLKIPGVAWVCSKLVERIGYFPAPRLGLGPEVEAAAATVEMISWKKLMGKWTNSEGFCYWDGMEAIHIPFFAYAGAADKSDPEEGCRILYDSVGSPEKSFAVLGKKNGYLIDYDHTGMIVSKEAQKEIWPIVVRLLKDNMGKA